MCVLRRSLERRRRRRAQRDQDVVRTKAAHRVGESSRAEPPEMVLPVDCVVVAAELDQTAYHVLRPPLTPRRWR
jgi:hypothetical protein